MEFCHRPTFLRSVIARDPFALKGIITPEDVLRLEEKFPTLFDKPPRPPTPKSEMPQGGVLSEDDEDNEEKVKGKPVQKKKHVVVARRDFKSTLGNKSVPKTVDIVPKRKTAQVSKPGKPEADLAQQKRPSEFHRKCNNATLVAVTTGQRKTTPVGKLGKATAGRKLTRPAQSFSLEDLRATLRQVLQEEKAIKQNAGAHSLKSLPSPYTEDLVKKFFGWKMSRKGGHGQSAVTRRKNSNILDKFKGQGDATSRMKAMTDTIAAYSENPPIIDTRAIKKLSAQETLAVSLKSRTERAIPRIRSAPGFIRGIQELPPLPNYQKKRIMLSMATRDYQGDDGKTARRLVNVSGKSEEQSGNRGDEKVENRQKHVRWQEDIEEEQSEHGDRLAQTGQEMNRQIEIEESRRNNSGNSHAAVHQNNSRPKQSGRVKGTQIYLHSKKRPVSDQLTSESVFAENDRFKVESSYQHLLDARCERSHYKLKRVLRKQEVPCNFYTKQVERERKEQKTRRAGQNDNFELESSSDPSEKFGLKLKEMGERTKEETNKILRQMAHELVYMEVLHQINELKREQDEADKDERKKEILKQSTPSSTSSSPRQRENQKNELNMPNFVPTTTEHEDESESKSWGKKKHGNNSSSEIILETPELTPPPPPTKRQIGKVQSPKVKDGSNTDVSLHTPELSPSSKRLIAAIKERKELEKRLLESPPKQKHQQQLDTDCSEISDFVFSEPNRKGEKLQKNTPSPVQSKKDSVKLETPELSGSQHKNLQLSRVEDVDGHKASPEGPTEKDGSTLSGVPSTFLETPSESKKFIHHVEPKSDGAHEPEHSGKSAVSKYSEDFTPEKGTSVTGKPNPSPANKNSQISSQSDNDEPNGEQVFSVHGSDEDHPDNLNTSGETVIDLLSEGEFIGTAYRSPGELSWRQERFHPQHRRPTLASIQSTTSSSRQHKHSSSYEHQLSFSGSAVNNDDEEGSISILSFGAQIAPENVGVNTVSVGEHVRS